MQSPYSSRILPRCLIGGFVLLGALIVGVAMANAVELGLGLRF